MENPRKRNFKKKGLDIAVHRRRIVKEDLDTKFKDPYDPFRIVFVCAMWMTGFEYLFNSRFFNLNQNFFIPANIVE